MCHANPQAALCCIIDLNHSLESEESRSDELWLCITAVASGGRSSEDAQAGCVLVPAMSLKRKDSVTALCTECRSQGAFRENYTRFDWED